MSNFEGTSTYDVLRQAIANRLQVVVEYGGYVREVCPHAIGSKRGHAYCLLYQFGGESSSGRIQAGTDKNWRCVPIEGLKIVEVREGPWYSGNNHSRRQTCVDVVEYEVDYNN